MEKVCDERLKKSETELEREKKNKNKLILV
jgi:hypothetical protein